VISAGATIISDDPMHARRDLVLTQIEPVHPLSGPDFVTASAEERDDGAHGDWRVRASARCAKPVPGQHTVLAVSTLKSADSGGAYPACADGERVLGGGAWVIQPTAGQVGITMLQADPTGTYLQAEAHEDADGYAGEWNVTAFAICAPKPSGYKISTRSTFGASWTELAQAYCIYPQQVIGSGGSVTRWPAGNVMLTQVEQWGGERYVSADAVENTATSDDWSVTAQAICAD